MNTIICVICGLSIFFGLTSVAGIIIWDRRRKESRSRVMAGWAFSRNWSFTDADDSRMNERYPYFECLQRLTRWADVSSDMISYASNIIEGSIGARKICAFDYHYEKRGDKMDKNNYYFSAVILDSGLPLKPLSIRDTNLIDKVEDFWGSDDIKFESIEFNKQFHVKSPDKKWAYDVLHQETMEFLLGSPHFYLDFHGRHVIAYRKTSFTVAAFEDAIQVTTGILDRLPESVVQELKEKKVEKI